jgi:hypothetical protein
LALQNALQEIIAAVLAGAALSVPAPGPAALPPYPVPPGAKEIEAVTFEGEEPEWHVQAPDDRFQISEEEAVEGYRSGYAESHDDDPEVANGSRSEISGPTHQLAELAYGGRFMIPSDSDWQSGWQIAYQWHAGSGSPPLALFVDDEREGKFDLRLGHGDGSRTDWEVAGVPRDEWHAFFVRVLWDREDGWIELWFDGRWQRIGPVGPNGVPRSSFATSPDSDEVYMKGGIYRDDDGEGTIRRYIDDVRVFRFPR